MLSDRELRALCNLGGIAEQAADELAALRIELALTKETNLSVVRRLQRELDEANAKLLRSENSERQAQRIIDDAYERKQYNDAQYRAGSGCDEGYGNFGYAG